MNQWTILTGPDWEGKCPPMPGRTGPTYAEQLRVVEACLSSKARKVFKAQGWREDPHAIYRFYLFFLDLQATENGKQ